jgi:hypothetical protein
VTETPAGESVDVSKKKAETMTLWLTRDVDDPTDDVITMNLWSKKAPALDENGNWQSDGDRRCEAFIQPNRALAEWAKLPSGGLLECVLTVKT